jgi:Transposase DNA-binding/Transposase DDE domain
MLNLWEWAKAQFGRVKLGNARRTERAVKVAAAMAERGPGKVPVQAKTFGEAKAAYRLFDAAEVTHAAITQQHRDQVIAAACAADGPVFGIHDDMLVDLSHRHSLTGLGPIGNGLGRGFMVHSCLMARPNGEVLGLAHQAVWAREDKARKKRRLLKALKQRRLAKARSKRGRSKQQQPRPKPPRARTEAAVWEETVAAIGPCPEGKRWISIGDRGADVFTHFEKCLQLNWQCLVRLAHDRVLRDGGRLLGKARAIAPMARRPTDIKGRRVVLNISWFGAQVMRPRCYNGSQSQSINCSVVRVWNDAEQLEWVLLSTLPVTTAEAAFEKVDWYKFRWLIEEFHKGLKTGCAIERSQLRTAERFLPLFGMASVVAVRLLQIRADVRSCPDGPVTADEQTIEILALALDRSPDTLLTNRDFAHGVATLGGFLDRKGDGEPGWQTLSRGLQVFSFILFGFNLALNLGCG